MLPLMLLRYAAMLLLFTLLISAPPWFADCYATLLLPRCHSSLLLRYCYMLRYALLPLLRDFVDAAG